jgi:hypothetical protein
LILNGGGISFSIAVAEAMTNKSIIFLKRSIIMVLLKCKYNELNNTIIMPNNDQYDLLYLKQKG